MPLRYLRAFFPLAYTASRTMTAPAIPASRSSGCRLGSPEENASVKPWLKCRNFSEASRPGARRTAWQSLSKRYTNSRYGRLRSEERRVGKSVDIGGRRNSKRKNKEETDEQGKEEGEETRSNKTNK